MHFVYKYKVLCINITLFFVLLSLSSRAGGEHGAGPLMGHAPLSIEVLQMLEKIKGGVAAYDTQLKSGTIEFSVTLLEKQENVPAAKRFNVLSKLLEWGWNAPLLPKTAADATGPAYGVTGYWYITYQFKGDTQFYDVKAHKKQEIDRRPVITETEDGYSTDIWQKTHHQYLIKNKTVFIRDGAVWKPCDKRNKGFRLQPSRGYFDKRFNPHWWRLPPSGDGFEHSATFAKFIHPYKTVAIKTVQIDGNPHYHLKLYGEQKIHGDAITFTRDLWMSPQKDFQVTRMVSYARSTLKIKDEGHFWPLPPTLSHIKNLEALQYSSMTWQHAHYEPGIWFPKTVTRKDFYSVDMADIFPDAPISEYPAMISEELLPKWFRKEYLKKPHRQSIMRVHRAVFNISVEPAPAILKLR